MKNVRPVRSPKGDKGERAVIELIFERYPSTVRDRCVELVFGGIPKDEHDAIDGWVRLEDVSGSSRNFWIFMWLCLASHLRGGVSPIRLVREIVATKSAIGILL